MEKLLVISNGRLEGDGMGVKLSISNVSTTVNPLSRVFKNCIFAVNAGTGWDVNNCGGTVMNGHYYNNFIYHNGWKPWVSYYENYYIGTGIWICGYANSEPRPAPNEMYLNNISYDNEKGTGGAYVASDIWAHQNNSWDQPGLTVTDDDFISLDTLELYRPRKADGSLPDIDFGKLAAGSDLIDAGAPSIITTNYNIPLIYNGSAPDLGWFESSSGTSIPVTPTPPIYNSSTISNATPSRLEMNYNLTLANIVPAASAFTVKVNTVTRTVSSVSISGTKVLLTLASPVVFGDVVTVAYTKPTSNPLQTTSGGQAASITAQNVTNNVAAVNPVYVSSVIENATPSRLDMTYNLTLANSVPAASAFTVKVNTVTRTVSSVSISGTKVLLTLASPVVYGDAVSVAYTKPASNPLQTATGGQAASITAQNVTNNVTAVNPVYVSSVIENATPSRLEMTYNLTLANIVPAASAFSVKVNTVTRTVSSVSISGAKVLLTLASPVFYGDVVTVAYTKPASNPLQTTSGGQAASITAQNVANNVFAVNQPPVVNISSPTKSTSFIAPASITIDAVASDPDGVITKVEFYQGNVKLGEITTAPYIYTWKEVPEGTYSITAAATDNQNLRTISSAVTVVVEKSTPAVNQLPVVSIITPAKDKKYKKNDKILLEVIASDPDGSISRVEFKVGDITMAEVTTPPYLYIWEAPDTGTFSFSAIATDNLGATSASSSLELVVRYDLNSEIIKLYPNPNHGIFTIDLVEDNAEAQEHSISIINLMGQTIYGGTIDSGELSKVIDMSSNSPGTYIITLTMGHNIVTAKKFIKQ